MCIPCACVCERPRLPVDSQVYATGYVCPSLPWMCLWLVGWDKVCF